MVIYVHMSSPLLTERISMHVDYKFILLSKALYAPRPRSDVPGSENSAIRGREVEVLSVYQLIEPRCQKIFTLSEEVTS